MILFEFVHKTLWIQMRRIKNSLKINSVWCWNFEFPAKFYVNFNAKRTQLWEEVCVCVWKSQVKVVNLCRKTSDDELVIVSKVLEGQSITYASFCCWLNNEHCTTIGHFDTVDWFRAIWYKMSVWILHFTCA